MQKKKDLMLRMLFQSHYNNEDALKKVNTFYWNQRKHAAGLQNSLNKTPQNVI